MKMSFLFHIAVLQMGVLRFHVNLDINSSLLPHSEPSKLHARLWRQSSCSRSSVRCTTCIKTMPWPQVVYDFIWFYDIFWLFEVWSSKAWSCSNILRWLWSLLYWFTQNFVQHESPTIEFTFAWVALNHCFSAEWFKFVPELVAVSRDLAAAETHRCLQVFILSGEISPMECSRTVKTSARHESHDMGAKWSIWSWCFQYLHQHLGLSDLDDLEFRYGKRKLTWQLWLLKRQSTATATICNFL